MFKRVIIYSIVLVFVLVTILLTNPMLDYFYPSAKNKVDTRVMPPGLQVYVPEEEND